MKQSKSILSSVATLLLMSLFLLTVAMSSVPIYQETFDAFRLGREQGLISGIKESFSAFDHAININMPFRTYFIDAYGGFARVLGTRVIDDIDASNTVYKMANGDLTFGYQELPLDSDSESTKDHDGTEATDGKQDRSTDEDQGRSVNDYARGITEFADFLEGEGIPLIYLQAPFKLQSSQSLLPDGLEEFSNKNADRMLEMLESEGVDTVDLRELRASLPQVAAFYRTDHHWRPEYGLASLSLVSERLSSVIVPSFPVDVTDFELQPSIAFLGSQGHRVGGLYAPVDQFQLIVPTFETDFSVKKYAKVTEENVDSRFSVDAQPYVQTYGDFETSIVDVSKLEPRNISDRYSAYFGGNFALTEITNNKVDKGNILVFSDSFGRPFNAFLSCYTNQLTAIDQRFYEASVREYILKLNRVSKIDHVIILYNPSMLDPFSDNGYRMFEFK